MFSTPLNHRAVSEVTWKFNLQKWEPFMHCGWDGTWVQAMMENRLMVPQKIKNRATT